MNKTTMTLPLWSKLCLSIFFWMLLVNNECSCLTVVDNSNETKSKHEVKNSILTATSTRSSNEKRRDDKDTYSIPISNKEKRKMPFSHFRNISHDDYSRRHLPVTIMKSLSSSSSSASKQKDHSPYYQRQKRLPKRHHGNKIRHNSKNNSLSTSIKFTATTPRSNTTATKETRKRKTRNLQSRIYGGGNATKGNYPFVVSFSKPTFGFIHFCGGALIAPNMVVSAAHCFDEETDEEIKKYVIVNVGRYNINDYSEETVESFRVIDYIYHPRYLSGTNQFDTILIKIDGISTIKPIKLNFDYTIPNDQTKLTVMGWGHTEKTENPGVLQEVNVKAVSNEICEQSKQPGYESYENQITPDMLCASDDNKDSCQGDSGGPLITSIKGDDGDEYIQVGIVSWGVSCALDGYPGVYSRISFFAEEFIVSNVCINSGLKSDQIPSYMDCRNVIIDLPPLLTHFPSATPTRESFNANPGENTIVPTTSPGGSFPPIAILITIKLDKYPSDTSFQISSALNNEIVFQMPRGSYSPFKEEEVTEYVYLEVSKEYLFTINDSNGDGICCAYGDGYYRLSVFSTGEVLVSGDGIFNDTLNHTFITPNPHSSSSSGNDAVDGDSDDGDTGATQNPQNPVPTIAPVAPTIIPTPEPKVKVDVTVVIQLDDKPGEVGWKIEKFVGLTQVEVYRVNSGNYITPNSQIVKTISLNEDDTYNFIITDTGGNGLCCDEGSGYYQIYVGLDSDYDEFGNIVNTTLDESKMIVNENPGNNYEFESTHKFKPILGFVFTDSPTLAPIANKPTNDNDDNNSNGQPYLTLEIKFDSFPGEYGWKLMGHYTNNETDITPSSISDDGDDKTPPATTKNQLFHELTTIAFKAETSYETEENRNAIITEQITNLPKNMSDDNVYKFTFFFLDSFGDGMCCEWGDGYYKLYDGSKKDNIVLATGDAVGTFRESTTFILPHGSDMPPIPPVLEFDNPKLFVTVEIQLNNHPSETGWSIEDMEGNILHIVTPGTYNVPDAKIQEVVALNATGSYLFTMFDQFGDGICCAKGLGSYFVYLGKNVSNNVVLVSGDGEFTFTKEHIFEIKQYVPVTVSITVDSNPEDVYWSLSRVDTENVEIIRPITSSYYAAVEDFSTISETLLIEQGGLYRFFIGDYKSDGMVSEKDGSYELYFGENSKNPFLTGSGDYRITRSHTFFANEDADDMQSSPTDAPSTGDTYLTLVIQFDYFPEECWWALKADPLETYTSDERTLTTDDQVVIAFLPHSYDENMPLQKIEEKISISRISLDATRWFTFIFDDVFSDGLCCGNNGDGYFELYYGPVDDNVLLASGDEFGGRSVTKFSLTGSQGDTTAVPTTSANQGPTAAMPSDIPTTSVPTANPSPSSVAICSNGSFNSFIVSIGFILGSLMFL